MTILETMKFKQAHIEAIKEDIRRSPLFKENPFPRTELFNKNAFKRNAPLFKENPFPRTELFGTFSK